MSSSKSIAKHDAAASSLTNGKFTPTRTGLDITGNPTIEEWLEFGERLNFIETSVQWRVGDYLAYGEFKYGEKYAQALNESQANSWKVYQWVAKRVPKHVRNPELPWSYYRDIARYNPDIQEKIVDHLHTSNATGRELSKWLRSIDDRVYEFAMEGELSEKQYQEICNDIVDQAISQGIDVLISAHEFSGYYAPRTDINCPHCGVRLNVRHLFDEFISKRRRGRAKKHSQD